MRSPRFWLFSLLLDIASSISVPSSAIGTLPLKLEVKAALDSPLANVHLSEAPFSAYPYTLAYGSCDSQDIHHTIATVHAPGADRLLWTLPEDIFSKGCLFAHSPQRELVGHSEPLTINKSSRQWVRKRKRYGLGKRSGIPMTNASGIDAQGPWFDGVEMLKEQEISAVNVKDAKLKKIAIVGAGMAGLMTYLCLNMSGFHNLELIEAGQRLGGRVETVYLEGGPSDHQYQDMGAMRFPETVQYAGTNTTLPVNDMKLVFQLVDMLNQLNKDRPESQVNLIPWIENNSNGLQYFKGYKKSDGLPPTVTEAKNLTAQSSTDPLVMEAEETAHKLSCDPKLMAAAATNVFTAHKDWLDGGLADLGGDDWSEFAYLHNYLKFSTNVTDQALVAAAALNGDSSMSTISGDSFWDDIYNCEYFSAVTWKTIDGGASQLPNSFHPLVDPITTFNRSIERAEFLPATDQIRLSWKDGLTDTTFQNATYDHAIIAVPFTKVRSWRFPNTVMDPTLKDAITAVPYTSICKVALQFSTRFWEHYSKPIFGSCSTASDIPGIGKICYPSYRLNSTGPGVMLASYTDGEFGLRFASLTTEEHVQYVLDAMIEIHGEVARTQYTGKSARKCWVLDPLESASWATPSIGMHELYIPAYFKTENKMIFVGEHTSYTHAWISSALESGIRGSVQLLLGLGLVDEAKAITQTFMARWIHI